MIQLSAQMRILVAVEPVDFRRGIDGLARVCREQLGCDPMGGAVFVIVLALFLPLLSIIDQLTGGG